MLGLQHHWHLGNTKRSVTVPVRVLASNSPSTKMLWEAGRRCPSCFSHFCSVELSIEKLSVSKWLSLYPVAGGPANPLVKDRSATNGHRY